MLTAFSQIKRDSSLLDRRLGAPRAMIDMVANEIIISAPSRNRNMAVTLLPELS
jgi:hypothetical protein